MNDLEQKIIKIRDLEGQQRNIILIHTMYLYMYLSILTFTFVHLTDAINQSDLQMKGNKVTTSKFVCDGL